MLPFGLNLAIIADLSMARMKARHQYTARRGTDGVAGIALSQSHSILGELINIRRANLRLSKAANVAIAQIIGHHEDEVGASFSRVRPGCSKPTGSDGKGPGEEDARCHGHLLVGGRFARHGLLLSARS